MVTMQEAIRVIKQLHAQLEAWVEIADEEDIDALDAAEQFLKDAGEEA